MEKIELRDYVKAKLLEPTSRLRRRIKYTYKDESEIVHYDYILNFRQQCLVDIPKIFNVEPTGEFIDLDEKTDLVLLKEKE
jgi:hypothetical protein